MFCIWYPDEHTNTHMVRMYNSRETVTREVKYRTMTILTTISMCEFTPSHTHTNQVNTSWVSNNLSQFWCYLPVDSDIFHRLKAQSYKTTPYPHPPFIALVRTSNIMLIEMMIEFQENFNSSPSVSVCAWGLRKFSFSFAEFLLRVNINFY